MFFKSDKKRRHPVLVLMTGALAAVGAASLVNTSKRWMCEKGRKVMGMFRPMAFLQDSELRPRIWREAGRK